MSSYYVKHRGEIKGPYSDEQLIQMLSSMKIGHKTPCRHADSDSKRMAPLSKVAPNVVSEVERLRKGKKLTDTEEYANIDVMMTTETAFSDLDIEKRLSIVSAEVALGMNLFRDVFTVARDIVGGRSKTIQNAFSKARKNVLVEMKKEAAKLNADAVVGISFSYNEISSGRSMLLLVGTGTAVRLGSNAPTEGNS